MKPRMKGVGACLAAMLMAVTPARAQDVGLTPSPSNPSDSSDGPVALVIFAEVALLFPSAVSAAVNGLAVRQGEYPGQEWVATGMAAGVANVMVAGVWLAAELEDEDGCGLACGMALTHLAMGVTELSLAGAAAAQADLPSLFRDYDWPTDRRLVRSQPAASSDLRVLPALGRDPTGELQVGLTLGPVRF